MATNRHLINDFDIRRPSQLLDKGLPLPGLSGKYVVDEGWIGVITEGGAYKDTLEPGTHSLNKYRFFRDLKATAVDTRIQTLIVSTNREFSIARPVPVEINLNISVEYRVSDPRRVALEIKTPLTGLFDRVIQAVRGAVVHAAIDEIRTQGEGIAATTLRRLQAMQLPKILGIEVFNVLVTSIKATDSGEDILASQEFDRYSKLRDWQLDQAMLAQSQMSWEWLLVHRPAIAQQLLQTYGDVARDMIDKGLLDPAGFLNQPTGQNPIDINNMNPMNFLEGLGGQSLLNSGTHQSNFHHQNPRESGSPNVGDIHSRMREEVRLLQQEPGIKVEVMQGVDEHGIADGSYNLLITLPRVSGGSISLYVSCLSGYPNTPPLVEYEIDGQDQPFESAKIRRWNQGQYLVEVAREAKGWFG